jgi:hypothetical protein
MKAAGELSWNCREIIAFRQSMMASPEGFSGPREKRIYYHANRSNRLVRMGRRHKVKSAFRAERLIQS